MAARRTAGHIHSPHTADLRIEAWAPTREGCIVEAVRGLVDSFADCAGCVVTSTVECVVTGRRDEDVLAAVLEEVIYRLDVFGEIVVRTQVGATCAGGWRVRLEVADAATATLIGAVPKAVSLHGLRFSRVAGGWSCAVTIDV